jgi:hypothetical protein
MKRNRIFQRVLSGALSFLSMAWVKVTDIGLLTLLIALGTLATALVAYRAALDSHEQVQLLKSQVDFNSMETRPFLRVKSSVSTDKPASVSMNVLNVGRVPGRVIAYDMLVQVGHKVIEPRGGTFNTHDVLYPDQPGLGVFQPLTQEDATSFARGGNPIVVGGCVIYGSITENDARRWKVSAAYRLDSVSELPIGLFAKEVSVPPGTERCDASTLREEWQAQLKLYPK